MYSNSNHETKLSVSFKPSTQVFLITKLSVNFKPSTRTQVFLKPKLSVNLKQSAQLFFKIFTSWVGNIFEVTGTGQTNLSVNPHKIVIGFWTERVAVGL